MINDTPSILAPLTTTVLGSVAWLVYTKLRRGPMISPTSIYLALITSIFGVRPLIMIGNGDYLIYGIDASQGFNQAALLGALATMTFVATRGLVALIYAKPAARQVQAQETTLIITLRGAFIVSLLAATFWLVSMATIGGGLKFIVLLFGGRSMEISAALSNVPVVFSSIPVAAAVIAGIARISTEARRRLVPHEHILFWAAIGISVVPPMALGIRRLLIPCLIIAIVSLARPKWSRRLPILAAALAICGGAILAALPYVRSSGARGAEESVVDALGRYFGENGLGGTLATFFYSNDTEMFSYVSYLTTQMGNSIPFGMGRATIIDLFWNAVPIALSGHPTWTDRVLTTIYGGGCATIACPVPSVIGVLYMDGGLIAVFIGTIGCAIALAWLDRAAATEARPMRLAFTLILVGFMPGLVRGDTMNQLWLSINVGIVSAVMIAALARKQFEQSGRRTAPVMEIGSSL